MRFPHSSQELVIRATPLAPPVKGFADDPKLNPTFVGQFVVPRFTPAVWAKYLEISTRLKSAIDGIATAAVGIGCHGVPSPEDLAALGEAKAKTRRNRLTSAADKITAFCRRPRNGSFLSITNELVRAEVDYLSTGYMTLEILEEDFEAGRPVIGLGHARSVNMRVSPNRDKWVQALYCDTYENQEGGVYVFNGRYYRAFGDEDPAHRFIDRFTGEFFAEWPKGRDESKKGSAILSACSYSPLDPYYGQPIHVTADKAIMGSDLAGAFWVSFLDGGIKVPLFLIAEGGQFTAETQERVEAVFNGERGGAVGGRAVLIQAKSALGASNPVKIKVERVELGMSDFAPLLAQRAANDAEILEATRMSSVFLGGAEGGNTTTRNAGVLKQLAYEHAIEPRTIFWETLLTNALAPKIAPGAEFRFSRPKNLDPLQIASLLAKLKDALSVEDMRAAARSLVSGIDIPIIPLGPNGSVPMALLESEIAKAAVDPKNQAESTNVRQLKLLPSP